MQTLNKYQKIGLTFFCICVFASCSTKKNTWINRQYHNTTAKYNGYFNGRESIKAGVKKIHASHDDDYTTILPVFPTGDLKKQSKYHSYMDKAIRKGSVVILRHSINIKGKEYCKWIDENYLMVGMGYFYKGELDEAIKTFVFVKEEFKKTNISLESSIWLIRSYSEKGDFFSAERELEALSKKRKLSKELNRQLLLAESDLFIKKKQYKRALKSLLELVETISQKRARSRYDFIIAQIYQHLDDSTLARKYYKKVLRSNTDYKMAFNTKMNLAKTLETNSLDRKKMQQKLLKMTRDDKNKEYLDQIYFTIAEMELKAKDTSVAIENYTLSTINSVNNPDQKALSFLSLANIDFKKAIYKKAKTNYDSTLLYMNPNHRLYEETMKTAEVLSDLVYNINVVSLQDSLQVLGKLTRQEQTKVINKIIELEIIRERDEAEQERIREQMMYQNNFNTGREELFGTNTSGGKWYFYNPATLSFGLSEFRKKWGNRKLEDDWRRKDKKNINELAVDTTSSDSTIQITENKKDPNYYFSQLPKSPKDYERSNNLIKESLCQIGLIYKEQLSEIEKSTATYLDLFKRYPKDTEYAPLALYNTYLNHKQLKNINDCTNIKKKLIKKYPNSIYAKILLDPDYQLNQSQKNNKTEDDYASVLSAYKRGEYKTVLKNTDSISQSPYKRKYQLLRSRALILTDQLNKAIIQLEGLEKHDDKISEEAEHLLLVINDPTSMEKSNELALTGTPYLYRPNSKHMIVVVVPKTGSDITYLKTLISDFHTNKIGNDIFEISALLLGPDKYILMIKSFSNKNEAQNYYNLFLKESTIMSRLQNLDYKIAVISNENFKEFYKNKDLLGYYQFFINKYLKQ